ncbi:MAG: VOC family protein [Gammaproteobacteria bacterium]
MSDEKPKPAAVEEFQHRPLFHLAFPVSDLETTHNFYVDVLGCRVGRRDERWMDFDFFGNQITAHLVDQATLAGANDVDGHSIPVPHFGLIMGWEDWHRAVDHMNYIGVEFKVAPHIRFQDEPGEQATFFLQDPSGNCLEFKSFRNPAKVFSRD